MKVVQEFTVAHDPATVWAFLDQPRKVAECVPGVESVEEVAPDQFRVEVTQKVGPISATFRAKVTIAERVEGRSLKLVSTGQVARGAAGSFRSDVLVSLLPEGEGTRVSVEGDLALAGMLGSIGQSVVERQTAALARTFATNLSDRLAGTAAPAPAPQADAVAAAAPAFSTVAPKAAPAGAGAPAPAGTPSVDAVTQAVARAEFWAKFAAATSTATLVVVLVLLGRLWG